MWRSVGATWNLFVEGRRSDDARTYVIEDKVWTTPSGVAADYVPVADSPAENILLSTLITNLPTYNSNIVLDHAPAIVNGGMYLRGTISGGVPAGINQIFITADTSTLTVEYEETPTTGILGSDGFASPLQGITGSLTDEWLVAE